MGLSNGDDTIELDDVTIKATTAKAVLVEYNDDEQWIPLSLIDVHETTVELMRGETGTLSVAAWLVKKHGWASED